MGNMGYRSKIYECEIKGIKRVKGKNLFLLHLKSSKNEDEILSIEIDQPIETIIERMKEAVNGKYSILYFTCGMTDIDLSYLGNNKWQLFNEYDFYEFEMEV